MPKKKSVLEPKEKKVELEIKKDLKPADFFQMRKGLYIFSSFLERILPKAEPAKKGFKFLVDSYDLKESATDAKIEAALPKNHNLDESDVCAIVAALIEKQPKGEEGTLLANGYANLFYTEAFVVDVRWRDDEWDVRAWFRGGSEWGAGVRVFFSR